MKREPTSTSPTPQAKAYLRFLRICSAIEKLPGCEQLDANHKTLFELAVLHWSIGEPLSVRKLIHQSELGSPATLHKRLQNLVAQDFLMSEVQASDKRTKYISPTPKGMQYVHCLGEKLLHPLQDEVR